MCDASRMSLESRLRCACLKLYHAWLLLVMGIAQELQDRLRLQKCFSIQCTATPQTSHPPKFQVHSSGLRHDNDCKALGVWCFQGSEIARGKMRAAKLSQLRRMLQPGLPVYAFSDTGPSVAPQHVAFKPLFLLIVQCRGIPNSPKQTHPVSSRRPDHQCCPQRVNV